MVERRQVCDGVQLGKAFTIAANDSTSSTGFSLCPRSVRHDVYNGRDSAGGCEAERYRSLYLPLEACSNLNGHVARLSACQQNTQRRMNP